MCVLPSTSTGTGGNRYWREQVLEGTGTGGNRYWRGKKQSQITAKMGGHHRSFRSGDSGGRNSWRKTLISQNDFGSDILNRICKLKKFSLEVVV